MNFFILSRRLFITKNGWKFIGVALGVGFAAINTGVNLLYLVLALMLSFIIISGILSEAMLKDIEVERILPDYSTCGENTEIIISIENRKKHIPVFILKIEDPLLPLPIFAFNIDPKKKKYIKTYSIFKKRGYVNFSELYISTTFPFGLFNKVKILKKDQRLLVLPANKNIGLGDGNYLRKPMQGDIFLRGRGYEFTGVREYQYGDDPRDISWKFSAKLSKLIIKNMNGDHSKCVTVFLDNTRRNDADNLYSQLFEESVEFAASVCRSLIENGVSVRLMSHSFSTPFGSSRTHLLEILKALALVDFDEGRENPDDSVDLIFISPLNIRELKRQAGI